MSRSTRSRAVPTAMPPSSRSDLTGMQRTLAPLELYRMYLRGGIPRASMAEHMNITTTEIENGRIVFVGAPEAKYYNPPGTVHGGYFGTLLDTAMSCAIHTGCKAGFAYTTLEYKVSLIRAMTKATGPGPLRGQDHARRKPRRNGRRLDYRRRRQALCAWHDDLPHLPDVANSPVPRSPRRAAARSHSVAASRARRQTPRLPPRGPASAPPPAVRPRKPASAS
jgi:uncharacterized protein (TIGR00369 family)